MTRSFGLNSCILLASMALGLSNSVPSAFALHDQSKETQFWVETGIEKTFIRRSLTTNINDPKGLGHTYCLLPSSTKVYLRNSPELLKSAPLGDHLIITMIDVDPKECSFTRGVLPKTSVLSTSHETIDLRDRKDLPFVKIKNLEGKKTFLKRSPDTDVTDPQGRGRDYCSLDSLSNYKSYDPIVKEGNYYIANIVYFTQLGCSFSRGYIFSEHVQETSLDKPNSPVEPKRRLVNAMLDVIACGEGTADNYNLKLGGVAFYGSPDVIVGISHPRDCRPFGSRGNCSTASGRYQFLTKTWDGARDVLNLRDSMDNRTQDKIATYLMQMRGVYAPSIDSAKEFFRAIDNLACEWASLGVCYRGQGGRHSKTFLYKVFQASVRGRSVGATCGTNLLVRNARWRH